MKDWAKIGQKSRKKSTQATRFREVKHRKTAYFLVFQRFPCHPDRTFCNARHDVNENPETRDAPMFVGWKPHKIGLKLGWDWAEKFHKNTPCILCTGYLFLCKMGNHGKPWEK